MTEMHCRASKQQEQQQRIEERSRRPRVIRGVCQVGWFPQLVSVAANRRCTGGSAGYASSSRDDDVREVRDREHGVGRSRPFLPHDAATVRARSIRHSKQSVYFVPSQGASSHGNSWRHRQATIIRASLSSIRAFFGLKHDETARESRQCYWCWWWTSSTTTWWKRRKKRRRIMMMIVIMAKKKRLEWSTHWNTIGAIRECL